jgi:RND family efflux transporter MFP subunit
VKRLIEVLFAVVLAGGVAYQMFGDRLSPATEGNTSTPAIAARPAGGPPAGAGGGRPGGGITIVTLAEVEETPYRLVYNSVGTLEAVARVTVQSDVSGRVTEIMFAPGDTVKADDALIQLDARQQELELQTALAQLVDRQADFDRIAGLQGTGTITAVQLQEAETNLQLAQVSMDRAQYEYDLRTIKAPINGTVGLTDAALGTILSAGVEITTVSQLDQVNVVFSVPESAAKVLELGRRVAVLVPSQIGQTLAANITAFGTEIDPVSRQIQVEALMDTSGQTFPHGTVASAVLSVEQEPAVVVPSLSIAWDRGGASVFEVRDGVAQRVPVTIEHRIDDQVWLDAELGAGAQVVVEGVQKVREGQPVMTVEQARERMQSSDRQDARDRPQGNGQGRPQSAGD